jgi:release factor glutamine methyltransferase
VEGEFDGVTVREALSWIAGTLGAAGIDSGEAEAGWMLWRLTGLSPVQMRLRGDLGIQAGDLRQLESWVADRCRRVPLQHLLGSAPFLEWELEVCPDVLVPRPETEVLALRAREWLRQALAGPRPQTPTLHALDIGTGSGCLALALASVPRVSVRAIDASEPALRVARSNARRLGFEGIEFLLRDVFSLGESDVSGLDLIVSNPPYIPTAEIAGLDPEVRDHDPRLALDGGEDGLEFYRFLALRARGWLKASGVMLLEFGDGQEAVLPGIFAAAGWGEISTEKDLSGRERILIVYPTAARRS